MPSAGTSHGLKLALSCGDWRVTRGSTSRWGEMIGTPTLHRFESAPNSIDGCVVQLPSKGFTTPWSDHVVRRPSVNGNLNGVFDEPFIYCWCLRGIPCRLKTTYHSFSTVGKYANGSFSATHPSCVIRRSFVHYLGGGVRLLGV